MRRFLRSILILAACLHLPTAHSQSVYDNTISPTTSALTVEQGQAYGSELLFSSPTPVAGIKFIYRLDADSSLGRVRLEVRPNDGEAFGPSGEYRRPGDSIITFAEVDLNNWPVTPNGDQVAWFYFDTPIVLEGSATISITSLVSISSVDGARLLFPLFDAPVRGTSFDDLWFKNSDSSEWTLKQSEGDDSRLGLALFSPEDLSETPVTVSIPPTNIVAPGSSLTIKARTTGNGLQFQWFKNGEVIVGQTRPELSFSNVSADDAGIYRVDVWNNPADRISSGECNLALSLDAPQLIQSSGGLPAANGEQVTLQVVVRGQNLSYSWKRADGSLIGDADNPSFSFIKGSGLDTYSVVVSNAAGSFEQKFEVKELINYTGTIFRKNTVNMGEEVIVDLRFERPDGVEITAPNQEELQRDLQRRFSGGAAVNDTDFYTASDSLETSSAVINFFAEERLVVIPPAPEIILGPSIIGFAPLEGSEPETYYLKVGDAVTLTAEVNPAEYVYRNKSSSALNPSPVTISVNELMFTWTKEDSGVVAEGKGLSNLLINNLTSTTSGTYFLTVSAVLEGNNGVEIPVSTVSSKISIVVTDGLSFSQQPENELTLAVGDSLDLSVGVLGAEVNPGLLTYQWIKDGILIESQNGPSLSIPEVGVLDQGFYQVRVSFQNDTLFSSGSVVRVISAPVFTLQPVILTGNQTALGRTFSSSVTVPPAGVYRLQVQTQPVDASVSWFRDGQPIGSGKSIQVNEADLPATFYSVASNGAGTVQSSSVTVQTLVPPTVTGFNLPFTVDAVENDSLNIVASVLNADENTQYQWYFNNDPVQGANALSLSLQILQPENEGLYRFEARNAAGTSSRTLSVRVLSAVNLESLTIGPANASSLLPAATYTQQNPFEIGSDRRIRISPQFTGTTPVFFEVIYSRAEDSSTVLQTEPLDIYQPAPQGFSAAVPSQTGVFQAVLRLSNSQNIIESQPFYISRSTDPGIVFSSSVVDEVGNKFALKDVDSPLNLGVSRGNLFSLPSSLFPLTVRILDSQNIIIGEEQTVQSSSRNLSPFILPREFTNGTITIQTTLPTGSEYTDELTIIDYQLVGNSTSVVSPGSSVSFGIILSPVEGIQGNLFTRWISYPADSELTPESSSIVELNELQFTDYGSYEIALNFRNTPARRFSFEIVPDVNDQGFSDNISLAEQFQLQEGGLVTSNFESAGVEPFENSGLLGAARSSKWAYISLPDGSVPTASYRLSIDNVSAGFAVELFNIQDDSNPDISTLVPSRSSLRSSSLSTSLNTTSNYLLRFYSLYDNADYGFFSYSVEVVENFFEFNLPPSFSPTAGIGDRIEIPLPSESNLDQDQIVYNISLNGETVDILGIVDNFLVIPEVSAQSLGTYEVVASYTPSLGVPSVELSRVIIPLSTGSFAPVFTLPRSTPRLNSSLSGAPSRQSFVKLQPQSQSTRDVLLNNFGLGRTPGEPLICGLVGENTAWVDYVPENDGKLIVSTDGSSIDTIAGLFLLEEGTFSFSSLTEIACDDNSGFDGSDSRIIADVTAGQTYYVVVDGKNGETGLIDLSITNVSGLDVTLNPSGVVETVYGSNLTLSAVVDEPLEEASFKWFKDDEEIPGESSRTIILESLDKEDAAEYRVEATSRFVTSSSESTIVRVGPGILTQPQSTRLLPGSSVVLDVTAAFSGTPGYVWSKDGQTIPGAAQRSLEVSEPGSYTVTVSDSFGEVQSETAIVTEEEIAQFTDLPAATTTLIPGSTLNLGVDFTGPSGTSVEWLLDDIVIPGANAKTLSVTDFGSVNEGNYTARLTTPSGAVTDSPEFLVTVAGKPEIFNQPLPLTLDSGSSIVLNADVQNPEGAGDINIQWFLNGNLLPGSTSAQLTLNSVGLEDEGIYTFRATNAAGSTQSPDINVDVKTPPVLTQSPSGRVVQPGETVILAVSYTSDYPASVSWSKNGRRITGQSADQLLITDFSTEDEGFYTATVSSVLGSVTTQAARIVQQVRTLQIVEQPLPAVIASGSSLILATSASGTGRLEIQWFLNGSPIGTANAFTFIVPDADSTNGGIYYAVIQDEFGNSIQTDSVIVDVLVAPQITQFSSSLVIEEGQPYTLGVQVTGSEPLTYKWFFNNTDIGFDEPVISVSNAGVPESGFYKVEISNPVGSIVSQEISLTVVEKSPVTISQDTLSSAWLLNFTAVPDSRYSLFRSSNLIDWEFMTQFNTADVFSEFYILDRTLPEAEQNFYKLERIVASGGSTLPPLEHTQNDQFTVDVIRLSSLDTNTQYELSSSEDVQNLSRIFEFSPRRSNAVIVNMENTDNAAEIRFYIVK